MGTAERLLLVGRPEGNLPDAVRAVLGRLRTDMVRYSAGRDAQGRLELRGARVVVELSGRDAGYVARQIAKRVHAPLAVRVEQGERGQAQVIVEVANA